MTTRLWFVLSNNDGGTNLISWDMGKSMNYRTFDPIAECETMLNAYEKTERKLAIRRDELTKLWDYSLHYVLYGDVTVMRFTTDVNNKPGEVHRESKVTEITTSAGFIPINVLYGNGEEDESTNKEKR